MLDDDSQTLREGASSPNAAERPKLGHSEMVAQSLEPLLPATTSNLSLGAKQLEVSKALHEKSPELQGIYLGGLWVKIQAENPDRLALAAHSFRELLEKLPRILAVPQKALQQTTNSQINNILYK